MTGKSHNNYLLISPHYPPPFVGGHKVWAHSLIEHADINFDILTSSLPSDQQEILQGSHIFIRKKCLFGAQHFGKNPSVLDLFVTYSYIIIWFIIASIRRRYQAVLVDTFIFENGLLFLLGRILRVPVIGMAVGEEFTITLMRSGLKSKIRLFLLKYTHRLAAGFIVVCDMCKDILVSYGVKADTIFVLPPSVNPSKIIPRNPGKQPGHRILSVGRLVERKGFHNLVTAVNILRKEIPDIALTIVGGGPFEQEIKQRIAEYQLEKNVQVKGVLSDQELAMEYQIADVFVLAHMLMPDGNTEGCPVVFAEAGAVGLPVIGGTGGGASTIIHENENGFIVDSRDINALAEKIKQILTAPGLSHKMGLAAIENIRKNHDPWILGKYFSVCMKTLASKKKKQKYF
jgi:phosphatidylinositol alpha-1,6-mannosyltransferase